MKAVLAGAWGYHLKFWRYGPKTEKMVQEALAREHWSTGEWEAWQKEKLLRILASAEERVPYYRNYWKSVETGSGESWKQLERWPLLNKESLRKSPHDFVAAGCSTSKMYRESTSGSTGTPLTLWVSRENLQFWYALFEARWRRWYGVSMTDRWAILGGQPIVRSRRKKPPFWIWNPAFSQLYMSSYHLSPDNLPYYLDALKRYRVKYLLGYPSALYTLARAVEGKPGNFDLKVIITNAEPLLAQHRLVMERAFGCPVRETYGMTEMVAAASECEHHTLHLWPEAGIVESIGEEHEIIATGLINENMPLIRYRVGDRAVLAPRSEQCPCGRTLPILKSLEGRSDDVVCTRDGKIIGRLDPVFKGQSRICEAQIIQETIDRIRILVVPGEGYSHNDETELIRHLRERLGEMEVVIEKVGAIPRGPNGKFRAVLSRVTPGDAGKRNLGAG